MIGAEVPHSGSEGWDGDSEEGQGGVLLGIVVLVAVIVRRGSGGAWMGLGAAWEGFGRLGRLCGCGGKPVRNSGTVDSGILHLRCECVRVDHGSRVDKGR